MSQHGYPERLSSRSKAFQEDGRTPATIEVLVETLTGTAFEMTVSPLDTVFTIKSKIFRVEGIPISQQHLLYNLKELDDASSLRDHQITDGATLRLVLSMRGGPISTRRLPLPTDELHWREIKELVENNRDESLEWVPSGCKVTVLVFRDGDNVNMIRVIENEDGTFSPLSENASSLKSLLDEGTEDSTTAVQENAVTMDKMLALRRRMEDLSMQRSKRTTQPTDASDTKTLQKTHSQETLSPGPNRKTFTQYPEADESFPSLYDGNYTRYDYDCSFADRYTLLPPIGSCSDSDQSVEHDSERADRIKMFDSSDRGDRIKMFDSSERAERIKMSDALAGTILVKNTGRREREDEAAILEESVCLEGEAIEECRLPEAQLGAKKLELSHAPIPTAEYGPLVGGEAGGWRVRRALFGSSGQLAPPAPLAAAAHSASSLQLRAPHPRPHPPLSDALFSSSTSDLEKLKRNRLLPALSRHRNREHLHLSDEGLDAATRPRNLEVGSERRHRRIKKIAELENARLAEPAPRPSLFRFDNSGYQSAIRKLPNDINLPDSSLFTDKTKVPVNECVKDEDRPPPEAGTSSQKNDSKETSDVKEGSSKKIQRVRCGLCRKRLSIATVHKCRCGAEFCAPHRYAEVHGCAYDYKAHAHQYLQRANPLVSAPKLPKI